MYLGPFNLWELDTTLSKPSHRVHFVFRSLTPLLEAEGHERIGRVLEQLIEQQLASGVFLLGLEYTKHDQETLDALKSVVDGVICIEGTTVGAITVSDRRTRD